MLKCLQDNTVSNYDQYCRQWVKTAQVTGDAMTINSKEYDLKISCDLDAKNQRFECEGEPLEYFSTGFHTSLQPSSQLNKQDKNIFYSMQTFNLIRLISKEILENGKNYWHW